MASQKVIIFLSTISFIFVEAVEALERNVVPSIDVCKAYANEEFDTDLQRCQNTCDYYGRTWDCPNNYKPKGDCYCKTGFARITEDYGKCVSVKNNATCVAKLPIKPESCSGPNEMYSDVLGLEDCDLDCRTFGCKKEYPGVGSKWSPRCICGDNEQHYSKYEPSDYRRLSTGVCVLTSDVQCVAEFQPSAERCAALGQIYTVNAPCQESCYGEQYCPPPGGACICPPNKLAVPHESTYYTWQERTVQYSFGNRTTLDHISHTTTVIVCYSIGNCPAATVTPPPAMP